MAYKISGTVSDDCKIYVINTSDDSLEQVKSVSAGAYSVDLLDEENVHVFAVRDSDSGCLGHGSVDAEYVFNDYMQWFPILTGNDDVLVYDTWCSATTNQFSFGSSVKIAALRFDNIIIPKDAQIEEAYIRVVSTQDRADNQIAHNIVAVAEDDSPQRTASPTWARPTWDALPKVSTVVPAVIPAVFPEGYVWTSPSIIGIIQELVNRTGWVAGNALTILMQDPVSSPDGGAYQRFAAYEHTTYDEPRLYVHWRA